MCIKKTCIEQLCAKYSSSKGAMKVLEILNTIYTAFDNLTDPKVNPNVYKVSFIFKTFLFSLYMQKNQSAESKTSLHVDVLKVWF